MLNSLTWILLCLPALAGFGSEKRLLEVAHVFVSPTAKTPVEGIRIAWDRRTLRRVSNPRFRSSGYSRMIQLRDQSLLCIYEADGSIMATKSGHRGESWEEPVAVAWKQDGIHMAAPDVLELQDGSILAMYNPRPWKISGSRTFGIRTRKSYDGGRTWMHGRLVHEAGHKFEDGCWEPAAVQMPNGEIRLFFADEGAFRKSSEQNISMLRSRDGGLTWTNRPEVVAFRPGSRDGMPAPLRLRESTDVVLAIEDLGWWGHFKPYIVRVQVSDDESTVVGAISADRYPALAESIGRKTYAGAPYLRQLSTGETILSYQGTEGRRNNHLHSADMKVAIGDAQARNFSRVSAPFPVPRNRSALWNSVTVLDDDTVVAICSTNAFSFQQEVWMIKGQVIPELKIQQRTHRVDGKTHETAWREPLPLFIGRDGQARLEAGICYDDDNLYVFTQVADAELHTQFAEVGNNDGVTVFIVATAGGGDATEDKAALRTVPTKPSPEALSLFVSADDKLVMKRGTDDGQWVQIPGDGTTNLHARHASARVSGGYVQELAIPWAALGGMPGKHGTLCLNISLTENTGRNVPDYRESISGSNEDKPHTWLVIKLQ